MGVEQKSSSIMEVNDGWTYVIVLCAGLLFAGFGLAMLVGVFKNVPWFIGVLFFGSGAVVVLAAKQTKILFDKTAGKMIVNYLSILGKRTQEYELGKITAVRLEQSRYSMHSHSMHKQRVQYAENLIFIFSDKTELAFLSLVKDPAMAKKVADFLGVGFERIGAPSLFETVDMMKDLVGGARGNRHR